MQRIAQCVFIFISLCGVLLNSYASSELLGIRSMNAAGDVLSVTNGADQSTVHTYHRDGSVVDSVNLLDNTETTHYNDLGALFSVAVKTGIQSSPRDSVVPVGVTHYSYYPDQQLQSISLSASSGSDASDVAYQYYTGGERREVSHSFIVPSSNPDQPISHDINYSTQYTYDPLSGDIETRWDSLGNALHYQYTANGVKSIAYYDEVDSITGVTSGAPKMTVGYKYGAFGKTLEIKRNPGYNAYNFYNDMGEMTGIIIGSGSYSDFKQYYNAIEQNGLSQNTYNNWKTLPSKTELKEAYFYHYSIGNNPTEIDVVSNTAKAIGYAKYAYEYNTNNQLTHFSVISSQIFSSSGSTITEGKQQYALYPKTALGTAIKSRSYTYGLNNNIKTVTSTEASTTTAESAKIEMIYHYDAPDYPNRLKSIETQSIRSGFPYVNQMEQLNNKDFKYNQAGSLIKNPEGDQYQYNAINQMVEGTSTLGSKQSYGYGTNGLLNYEQSTLKTDHGKYIGSGSSENGKPVYYYTNCNKFHL